MRNKQKYKHNSNRMTTTSTKKQQTSCKQKAIRQTKRHTNKRIQIIRIRRTYATQTQRGDNDYTYIIKIQTIISIIIFLKATQSLIINLLMTLTQQFLKYNLLFQFSDHLFCPQPQVLKKVNSLSLLYYN